MRRLAPLPLLAFLLITIASVGLAGCTSGHDTSDENARSGGDNSSGSGNDNTDTGNGKPSSARFGSFDDTGVLESGRIQTSHDQLVSGQSADLSVALVGADGKEIDDSTDVFFSSGCARQGLADIAPAVVTNTDGHIQTGYTARGCTGDDVVTAKTSVNGATLEARVTIRTTQSTLGALQFDDASQPLIGIRGTGILPEQSVVAFTVTDASGRPVPNQPVEFALDTRVGGLALNRPSAVTDRDGQAAVTVTAGTQATTAQVRAHSIGDDGRTVSARSNVLAVTTGIPDNDSFSVSAEKPNIEGWDYDGTSTRITVRAADRFNNPVPDGTAVNFTTEGGSIPGSCVTQDGVCSVTFTAQDPRPANGRVTIRATAIGEESFVDSSPSNGRYDTDEHYTDLPEAFRDDNENGRRDSDEPYLDFNNNGSYDRASGTFNGLLCQADHDQCAARETLNVRRNIVIVLSGSSLYIKGLPNSLTLSNGPVTITPAISDRNGQIPPAGTIIEASVTQGSLDGETSYTVPADNAPGPYSDATFHIQPADSSGSGWLRITATTPEGTISRTRIPITQ